MTWTKHAAALLAVGAVALAGCTGTGSAAPAPAGTTTTSTTSTTGTTSAAVGSVAPMPTTTPTTITPTATTTTSAPTTSHPPANAGDQLADFVTAARRADAALRFSAARINSNLETSPTSLQPATARTVTDAERAVATVPGTIPAGLDVQLLQPVLAIESGLVSRKYALSKYVNAFDPDPAIRDTVLSSLGRGSPAAGRFDADLEQLRATAARHRLVRVRTWDSEAGLELALRLYAIGLHNGCGGGWGGYVTTRVEPLTWKSRLRDGHAVAVLEGSAYEAVAQRDHTWKFDVDFC